jgi:hypothetical protein
LSGIAFDPLNASLWVSAKGSPVIQDYSLDGTLLAAFDTGLTSGYLAALGYDAADDTLWLSTGGTNLLRQYSVHGTTFGQLLQEGTPSGLPREFYDSGDFQVTPEPATFVLLLGVIAVISSPIRLAGRR